MPNPWDIIMHFSKLLTQRCSTKYFLCYTMGAWPSVVWMIHPERILETKGDNSYNLYRVQSPFASHCITKSLALIFGIITILAIDFSPITRTTVHSSVGPRPVYFSTNFWQFLFYVFGMETFDWLNMPKLQ